MFPPVKRVTFKERLVEFLPTPVIEGLSDTEVEPSSTEDDHKRRRELIEAEDGHSTPVHRRRKKRDWVWRPVEDDVLTSHDLVSVRSDVIHTHPDFSTGKGEITVMRSSVPE